MPRALLLLLLTTTAPASQVIRDTLPTTLTENPIDFAVLLPPDYSDQGAPLPLLLLLHGSGGDREQLVRFQPQLDEMWSSGALPPIVVATPSVARGSIYLDSYDGKNKWETFIMAELLPHLRQRFNISSDRKSTLLSGTSMGGFGSLRLGFKHPETFGAIASMEAGAWPGVTWDEVPGRNKFRPPASLAALFGDPFDHARFARENPASILDAAPERLRDTAIYLECGDEDGLGYMEGAEYLHRLLWRHNIRHEYRLVRWADHIGSSIMPRSRNRFEFLARYLRQPLPPEPDLISFRERRAASHKSLGMERFGFWPNSPIRDYATGDYDLDFERALGDSEHLRKQLGIIRISDIPYDQKPGVDPQRLSLDIYLKDGMKDAPIVLYVHGGGWVRWSKSRALFKPVALVPKGYLLASSNYRLRPHAQMPDLAQDVANTVIWLKKNATKYGGDPKRIFLIGHSAGAHLIALIATNEQYLETAGGSLHDLSGVVPLDNGMYHVPRRMQTAGESQLAAFGSNPSAWPPVSPWHHVEPGKGIPPFLILTANSRPERRQTQALPMLNHLKAANIEAQEFHATDRAHTPLDTYLGTSNDPATTKLLQFLQHHQ